MKLLWSLSVGAFKVLGFIVVAAVLMAMLKIATVGIVANAVHETTKHANTSAPAAATLDASGTVATVLLIGGGEVLFTNLPCVRAGTGYMSYVVFTDSPQIRAKEGDDFLGCWGVPSDRSEVIVVWKAIGQRTLAQQQVQSYPIKLVKQTAYGRSVNLP